MLFMLAYLKHIVILNDNTAIEATKLHHLVGSHTLEKRGTWKDYIDNVDYIDVSDNIDSGNSNFDKLMALKEAENLFRLSQH
jgi:hypothetical protein